METTHIMENKYQCNILDCTKIKNIAFQNNKINKFIKKKIKKSKNKNIIKDIYSLIKNNLNNYYKVKTVYI